MKGKKRGILIPILLIALVIAGCNSQPADATNANDAAEGGDMAGGELNIAINAQPPTLDTHLTTTSVALDVTRNIFETLVAPNAKHEPVPVLAESIESSEDGKTYTFHLRKGVKFHNGKEMTAEDVEASMNRWLENSARAKLLLSDATFKAEDSDTVVLKLKQHASDVLDIMAGRGQFPAIMPKEVVESATEEGVKEFIGTGPFQFKEWKQDQYIHLEKFEDYEAVDEEPSGLAGKKEALVDDVYYHIVTDPSTRLAGIQTGEYDVADTMPYDNYEQLKNTPNVETYISFDEGTLNLSYNKKEGIMTDPKMRQAINAALDMDKIMLASFANEDLYKLSPSYMNTEQVNWASEAGKEAYNQADAEKAKSMLKEAGYNGEEITLMATRDYDYHYNSAVVVKEQLEQIGMKVKLEIYDWPTLVDLREDPANWDLLIVGTGYVTTPSQLLVVNPDYAGWTNDAKITELLDTIRASKTQEEAKQHWDQLQGYIWNEYVPFSLFGHYSRIVATTDKLEGFTVFQGPIPWNTKVTE